MVMLESMAGTGHKYVRLRPRLADKLERLFYDPIGLLLPHVITWCLANHDWYRRWFLRVESDWIFMESLALAYLVNAQCV